MPHPAMPRIAAALLATCLVAPAPGGESATLVADRDNTLFSTGTTSNGAGPNVFSGRTGMSAVRQRAVLRFDLASTVPAGATIVSAELTLTVVSGGGAPAQMHALHRLGAGWGEGTSSAGGGSGAPATPGDATWLHTFFPDQFWATPGGDFDAARSAEQSVSSTPGPVTWGSTPALVADVQAWIDDPAANHGWILIGNETVANGARKLASREFTMPEARPTLTVAYELPPSCPADLNGNGHVGFHDLIALLHAWGLCEACPEDLNGNGRVGIVDLLMLIVAWGPCD